MTFRLAKNKSLKDDSRIKRPLKEASWPRLKAHHQANRSVSLGHNLCKWMETEALQGPGLICHQPAVGVRPVVSGSAHLTRALRRERSEGGWRESQRTRAELCCKGWLCVLRGLVSWMLYLCWSGWLQADVANEGGAVVCWHCRGKSSWMTSDWCLKMKCFQWQWKKYIGPSLHFWYVRSIIVSSTFQ